MRFGNRRAHGEVVADEQCQRFDLMFWSRSRRSMARQAIQALGNRRLALVGGDRATATMPGGSDDAGLDTPFLGGQFIDRWACSGWMKEFRRCGS